MIVYYLEAIMIMHEDVSVKPCSHHQLSADLVELLELLFEHQVLEYVQHKGIWGQECVVHLLCEHELFHVFPTALLNAEVIFGLCIALLLYCFICLLLHGFLGLFVVNGAFFELVLFVVNAIDEYIRVKEV